MQQRAFPARVGAASGFGVCGLEFGVCGLGIGVRGLCCVVCGVGFRFQVKGFKVKGLRRTENPRLLLERVPARLAHLVYGSLFLDSDLWFSV